MDNAPRAWELPLAMRQPAPALLLLIAALLATRLGLAAVTEARSHVEEAEAALAREPPDRTAARAALQLATNLGGGDAEATAEAHFLLGQIDEDESAFGAALDAYREARAVAPSTRWALRASDRMDWIHARSEGDFRPLVELERVRRNPALAADPGAIDDLARQMEAFPPGTVRVEARMLVAEAWLGRMHRPEAAIGALRAVSDDPKADPLTARLAERELVDVLVASGRIDEAAAEAREHANRLDARFVRQVVRQTLRRSVRYGALVIVGAFALLAALAIVRAARRGALGAAAGELRRLAPVAILFVAFVAVGGGLLASNYESGNASPFLLLGVAVLPLVLVARAWGAVGSASKTARVARAVLCAATVLAAAFLLLDSVHPQYLAGFGL
jgi:hypothetical protein